MKSTRYGSEIGPGLPAAELQDFVLRCTTLKDPLHGNQTNFYNVLYLREVLFMYTMLWIRF